MSAALIAWHRPPVASCSWCRASSDCVVHTSALLLAGGAAPAPITKWFVSNRCISIHASILLHLALILRSGVWPFLLLLWSARCPPRILGGAILVPLFSAAAALCPRLYSMPRWRTVLRQQMLMQWTDRSPIARAVICIMMRATCMNQVASASFLTPFVNSAPDLIGRQSSHVGGVGS